MVDDFLQRLNQPVPDPGLVPDQEGIAQFLPEEIGVDPQVVGLIFRLGSPDFAQDLALGDDLAGMPGQRPEKGELGGSQLQLLPLENRFVAVQP